jgi:CDP-4-dehydro-6-deoxyglucose reductase
VVNTVQTKATIRTVLPQTRDISTLRLDFQLSFKPGQSVAVTFPGEPKKRYYSISSSPSEGPFVEITVKAEAGSALAAAIGQLKRGDSLDVEGPFGGSLSLPEPVAEPLAFIAAGTGITPFRSMVRFLIDNKSRFDTYLMHSVRNHHDLLFREELIEWSTKYPHFHYIPTLTRNVDDTWKNETGRIGEALLRKHLTMHPCTYLLCGPTAFVNDMEKLLRDTLGILSDRIRREKW